MAFDSLVGRFRLSTQAMLQSEVYDEQTFHHFLAIERWRAEETGRSFFLVLVNSPADSTWPARMPPDVSGPLFSVLLRCIREVDFIGWYAHDTIAGAVMTQREAPASDAADVIVARFKKAFRLRLPQHIASHLEIRVVAPSTGHGTN